MSRPKEGRELVPKTKRAAVSQHSPTRQRIPKIRLVIEDAAVFHTYKKMATQLTAIDFQRSELDDPYNQNPVHAFIHHSIEISEIKKTLNTLGKNSDKDTSISDLNEELWISVVFKRFFEQFENKAFLKELFGLNSENTHFEVEICPFRYLTLRSERWQSLQHSNDLQDSSHYFWTLDSDGIGLSVNNLNHANSISVSPLKPFFPLYLSRKPGKYNFYGALTQESQILFHHYILILHPNAEVFSYVFSEESRTSLKKKVTTDTEAYSIDLFFPSFLYLSIGKLPWVRLNEDNLAALQKIFFENTSQSPQGMLFMPLSELEFKEYFSLKEGTWADFRFLSGACYLRKVNRRIPLKKRQTALDLEFIENQFSLFKWKVEKQEADPSKFVTSWSNPKFCNSRTKIKMTDLTPEKQELYDNGFEGFKPCERHTGGAIHCYQHR